MKLFCEERSDEWKGTSEVSKGRIVSNIWKIVSYTAIDDVCEEGSDEMKVSNRQDTVASLQRNSTSDVQFLFLLRFGLPSLNFQPHLFASHRAAVDNSKH